MQVQCFLLGVGTWLRTCICGGPLEHWRRSACRRSRSHALRGGGQALRALCGLRLLGLSLDDRNRWQRGCFIRLGRRTRCRRWRRAWCDRNRYRAIILRVYVECAPVKSKASRQHYSPKAGALASSPNWGKRNPGDARRLPRRSQNALKRRQQARPPEKASGRISVCPAVLQFSVLMLTLRVNIYLFELF
jgi:hypothetical protein